MVVRQYSAPAGSNDAVMVHAELAMLGKSAIVAKGSEVQAADLVQHVTRCFGNQACPRTAMRTAGSADGFVQLWP